MAISRRRTARILGATVDDSVVRADGVGADEHALQHAMRIAFEQTAIHEGARIALVSVAHQRALERRLRAHDGPLAPVGNPPAAASAQAGRGDQLDDLFWGVLLERPVQRPVAAAGDVLVDVLRVDPPGVRQNPALLVLVERNVGFGDLSRGVEQPLDDLLAHDVLLHDLGHVGRLHATVKGGQGLQLDDGAHFAQALAPVSTNSTRSSRSRRLSSVRKAV